MQACAWLCHETTSALVAPTGPWIKALQSLMKSPLNRCVVTDLEMKAVDLLITAPVAAPEMGIILNAE